MRYPKDLAKGGTIGFLAPSFGCNTEPYRSAFDHALDRWQGMGYRTVTGPNCYVGEGVGISNTPEKCAAEVMEMFCGKEADVLISCGGGAVLRERNIREMKRNGRVVLLTASPETVYERVKDSDDRPVLNGRKNVKGIKELMEQRRGRYEAAADIVINTDNKTVMQVCEELVHRLMEMEEE